MKTRMDQSTISELWEEFHKTREVELRNRIVEHYVPLVNRLAEVVARRLWPRVSADELASAGYDGLIAAVGSFDSSREVKFETYCRQRIVGAIRDWQREIDPLDARDVVSSAPRMRRKSVFRPSEVAYPRPWNWRDSSTCRSQSTCA